MNESLKNSIDTLIGKLIGLARAVENNKPLPSTNYALLRGFYVIYMAENKLLELDDKIEETYNLISEEKHRLVPDCSSCAMPCGRTNDYDMENFYTSDTDTLEAKTKLILKLSEASKDYLDNESQCPETLIMFMYKALSIIGYDLTADAYNDLLVEFESTKK